MPFPQVRAAAEVFGRAPAPPSRLAGCMSTFSGLLTKIGLTQIGFATTPPYPNSPRLAVMPRPDAPWCVDATSKLAPA